VDHDKRVDCGPHTFEECREKGKRLERQGNNGCCWGGVGADMLCYHKKKGEEEEYDKYDNYDSHFNNVFTGGR